MAVATTALVVGSQAAHAPCSACLGALRLHRRRARGTLKRAEKVRTSAIQSCRVGRAVAALLIAGLIVPVGGATSAPSAANGVPGKLIGRWNRNITHADFRGVGSEDFGSGIFAMVVKQRTLDVYLPGSTFSWFTTRLAGLSGGRLAIGGAPGEGSPGGGGFPYCRDKGLYRWKLVGRLLTMTKLSDPHCPSRVALYVGIWRKK